MEGGNIVQVGTPIEILRNPADDYVRSFFRNVDVAQVLRAGDVARLRGGKHRHPRRRRRASAGPGELDRHARTSTATSATATTTFRAP